MFVLSLKFVCIQVTLFNTLVQVWNFFKHETSSDIYISVSHVQLISVSHQQIEEKRWFSFLRKKCKLKIHKGWKCLKFPVYSWIFSALICAKCVLSILSLLTKKPGNPSCFSLSVGFIGTGVCYNIDYSIHFRCHYNFMVRLLFAI